MSLDPLRFAVEIQDNAKTALDEIEAVLNRLSNVTVTINAGGDVSALAEQLRQIGSGKEADGIKKDEKAITSTAEASKAASEQLQKFLGTLQQIGSITLPDLSGVTNAIKGLQVVNIGNGDLAKIGESLGGAADRIREAKEAINGGNFGVLANRIKRATEELVKFDEAFGKLYLTIGKDQGLKDFMTGLGEVIRNVRTTMQSLGQSENAGMDKMANTYNRNAERIEDALFRIQEARAKVTMAIQEGDAAGMNVSGWKIYLQTLDAYEKKLQNIKANSDLMNGEGWQTKAFGTTLKHLLANADDFQKIVKANAEATKKAQKETDAWGKTARDASEEVNKLEILIRKLNRTEQDGAKAGANTSALKGYIRDLELYRDVLHQIATGSKVFGHTTDVTKGTPFNGVQSLDSTKRLANESADAVKRETTELERNQNEKKKNASSASLLTAEEQRLAQALNHTAESAKGQSQVLSDLKSMAMQYLGVWGGQQFLRNIIEIGGQLEMQRLSIGAILQNQSQANDLFEKIKGLAVQSPFGVVELDQMTKQLTAYGFKYNELYDMTKRLADISAATGTGVDRLALALGNVRSEAALSGYTLRQFSMGNVPLLQKLSEKLGKTTQEIRKMVRSKEISYEDVVGVLKDLTDEGGMFYNMQETISQSVKARFKNVKDAMDIMYGEMAEGGIGEALKDVADVLMDVTKNWKDVATVIGTGAAVWGIQRAAIMLNTKALGVNSAATLSAIKAHIKREGILLSEAAAYRTLSASELQTLSASRAYNVQTLLRIALGKKLTVEQLRQIVSQKQLRINALALAIQTKKLTIEELSHMVAMGKVSKETAILSIKQAGLKADVQSASIAMIEQTRVLTLGQKAAMAASTAVKTLGAAFKSFAPMLLITGIIEAFQRVDQMKERAEELGKDIMQMSQDNLQSARKMMEETGIQAVQDKNGKQMDVTNVFGTETNPFKTVLIKPEFDHESAQSTMDQWAQFIREYSATPNRMLNNALLDDEDNVRSLQEQYDLLFNSIQEVIQAQAVLANSNYSLVFESAQAITSSGWWDDDVADDAQDYVKARKEFIQQVTKLSREYPTQTKKVIDTARREDAAFAKATEGMSNYNDMLIKLIENRDKFERGNEILGDILYTPNTDSDRAAAYTEAKKAAYQQVVKQSELDNEINEFIAGIQTAFSGVDMSPAIQQALLKSFKMALEKMGNLPKDLIDGYMKQFADAIGAEMDEAEEKQIKRLADWQKRASKSFEVNHEIKVKTTTITSMDEFAQAVQKDLKEKQEYVNRNQSHIKMLFHIEPQFKVTTKYLNAYIDLLIQEIGKLSASGQTDVANMLMSQLYDELVPFRDALASLEEDKKWLKSEGYPETDKNKTKNKKGTGDKKTYKDPEVQKWKTRVDNIKAAYKEYEKWEKEIGNDAAIKKVHEQYKGILDEDDIKNITKYRETLLEIKDLADARYQSQKGNKKYNNGKDAQDLVREINKFVGGEIDMDIFKKASDKIMSETDKLIQDLTRRWETYNQVREATGNKDLAFDLAGIIGDERNMRNAADAMRDMLVKAMEEAGASDIPLDIYIDEETLREQFKKALGESDAYATSINSLVKAYQEWQKLQQDVIKNDTTAFAKIIGAAKDYASQLKKIDDELDRQTDQIRGSGASFSQKTFAVASAVADADWKKMKMSASYANLYNNAIALSSEEFNAAAASVENMINVLRTLGRISPEEYKQEMEHLAKARTDYSTSGFFGIQGSTGQFLAGGYDGLMEYYQKMASAARERASKAVPGSQEARDAEKEVKKYEELYAAMEKLKDGAGKVVEKLQQLQTGLNMLSEMFDSLGMEGAANAASDAGGILGSALGGASSLASLGPYGMAAGAAIGLVSGIAQTHDKALERQIEKLRDDVQKIEANTKLIQQARERELGYDSGNVRRQMAQQYAVTPITSWKNIGDLLNQIRQQKTTKSMYEYYSQDSQGSGYEQEYKNLVKQREDYLDILSKEQAKKKKSNSDIEETKAKIAELDDQIRYFSQDLAKELWDIDIKSWADQISDALASAFENGESAAKAYGDTVRSILQQMMRKMMQMSILEPMFESLQDKLFGEKGVFDASNPAASAAKVQAVVADFFGKGGEGEQSINAATEFMVAWEHAMKNSGLSVLNDSANTLSSAVNGMSEETSSLLAGYVNALRQDVSINRIYLTQFVTQMWPSYIESFTNQVTAVNNIDTNVQAIMQMMQVGSGALYEQVASLRERIDRVALGLDSLSVK